VAEAATAMMAVSRSLPWGGEYFRVVRALKKIALVSVAAGQVMMAGCQPAGPLGRAGLSVTPPASWRPVKPSPGKVPGIPLAAWAGPDGSSLVIFRTLPVPGGSPSMIAEALANRLTNLPGLRLVVERVETVGGMSAARVEVVAPGTGDALAPSGLGTPTLPDGKSLIPTRQVTLGFLGPAATLYVTWHAPESSYGRIAPDIEATLKSFRLTAGGKISSYEY
jgi:hypothetical protein